MKRYALILALVMAIAAGFGFAKKTQDATGDVDDMSPEMRAAIQQITDGRVLFAFDKFDIQPQYKDMLTAKAELMKKYPSIRVRIEGNCDARGTQEYNLALGERRALAVMNAMNEYGVGVERIRTISYGEDAPAAQGTDAQSRALNRRAVMLPAQMQ